MSANQNDFVTVNLSDDGRQLVVPRHAVRCVQGDPFARFQYDPRAGARFNTSNRYNAMLTSQALRSHDIQTNMVCITGGEDPSMVGYLSRPIRHSSRSSAAVHEVDPSVIARTEMVGNLFPVVRAVPNMNPNQVVKENEDDRITAIEAK